VSIKETVDQKWSRAQRRSNGDSTAVPGLVLVFSGTAPRLDAIPFARRDEELAIELGRGVTAGVAIDDECMSRRHARVSCDPTATRWIVCDLDSRNGTAVDGLELEDAYAGERPIIVRVGDSLFLPFDNVQPFAGTTVRDEAGMLVGATLARAMETVAGAARAGETLHISGESGSGKELVARAFHAYGPAGDGPFVAVNCATIPEGLAERLLFGARRGAYSGADEDARGHFQAAHGGTLFLDEIGELDLAVQAKLLRVLETREVQPLGAARASAIDVRFCSATHKDLLAEVAAGRFREDLYFRIGRPSVVIPPLRERREDIPHLVAAALQRAEPALPPHVSLVEECLLRHWPGNVRELLVEVRAAARAAAAADGRAVLAEHLGATAGARLDATTVPPVAVEEGADDLLGIRRDEIDAALRREGGNVTRAARSLGVHRTQLRRWLAKHGRGAG
jgi:transcriptional regulator with GAF, ATPase, and Fis domain